MYFKGGGKQFIDPSSGKKGILFNVAGAAKSAQGGFVVNRLILGHIRVPSIERQMILSSGGVGASVIQQQIQSVAIEWFNRPYV
ncbi:hypothetical protein [Polynucleobacter necessarius]|uniref:hypothetical protein n=1 Tax=Polynucleobacter necessarius TaxID=576610 RepID=UPI001E3CDC50|nr:hypothetical protein [Polynucleobacter necessarius]